MPVTGGKATLLAAARRSAALFARRHASATPDKDGADNVIMDRDGSIPNK
jgi:hypothetical protein